MKPPPFAYARPHTVGQAIDLLAGNPDARVLAGGQSLLPLLNLRLAGPDLLVDIGRVAELQAVTVGDHGLTIGAGVIQADAAADPRIRAGWPLLAAAIDHIGHPQIRNRGTVCGSLAHNDPLAELPAVAVAMDATLVARSAAGQRRIAAGEMFTGPFTTALAPAELLVAVDVPPQPPGSGWSFQEHAPRSGDFATAGVATRLTATDDGDGPVVGDARVVLIGVGPSPLRATVVEEALLGSADPAVDEGLGNRLAASLEPPDDVHGSADARRALAVELVARSVEEAWRRAGEAGR